MQAATGQSGCAALVTATTDAKFGDYQANGVMALAKKAKTNPRKLAEDVLAKLDISDICESSEIAGPGFINLRLKPEFLTEVLLQINADHSRLAVDKAKQDKIVVDYCGPNLAKEMHVGHLRSTIIGDSICRILEFLGHDVVRQNHVGDWGTQFGMLIAHMNELDAEARNTELADLEIFYKAAKKRFDEDEQFADLARQYVVRLQSKDEKVLKAWTDFINTSQTHCQQVCDQLNVTLLAKHTKGESSYNDDLPCIVEDLKKAKLAKKSEGAVCIFPEGFKNKQGDPLPFIIQKTDGAFLYATTDLAALRYRIKKLAAKEIVYVTDSRQKLHFEMLFAVGRMAGWLPENVKLSHVMFGTVLGEYGKPFKTRSGQSVKLKELLDEASGRAKDVVEEKNPDLSQAKKDKIAKAVGIGAVKYADYSNNRTSDYIFSFDKMLAMEGNTAPYMQYAYARIKSIERKGSINIEAELADIKELNLTEPAELDLAKHIIRYSEAIALSAADYRPNFITSYLYELAQKFSSFYGACPVLKADADKRPTRLMLCDLTARTIRHGLEELLGINVIDQM